MSTLKHKDRFRIFARDGFKCRYCGRGAPEVRLELDHRTPKSKGGKARVDNLVTACFDCNRGKRDILLPIALPIPPDAWKCADCCPHGCDMDHPHATWPARITNTSDSLEIAYIGRCGHEWTSWYDAEYACELGRGNPEKGATYWPIRSAAEVR